MLRFRKYLVFALLVASMIPNSAVACPTCKSALHSGLALGYAISIIFMMAMPFVIFGFWIVTIVRLRAKATPIDPVEILLGFEKEPKPKQ